MATNNIYSDVWTVFEVCMKTDITDTNTQRQMNILTYWSQHFAPLMNNWTR